MTSPKDSRPQSIGRIAMSDQGALGGINRQSLAMERLNKRLERVLPQDMNGHVRAVGLKGHTLLLAAESPAWASRLRYEKRHLLDLLSKIADSPIGDVRIRVVPPSLARTPKPKPRKLSSAAAGHLDRATQLFDDPEIQASLKRLAHKADGEG